MTKDVNKSAYTKRILEIVANINKQKQDINKVKFIHIFWFKNIGDYSVIFRSVVTDDSSTLVLKEWKPNHHF